MRKLFKGSSEKNRKNLNLWPSPSFFFLSFDVMIGPLLFDQGHIATPIGGYDTTTATTTAPTTTPTTTTTKRHKHLTEYWGGG
jgi:hypothetical protein